MCYVWCGVFAAHYTDRAKAAFANIKLGFYSKTFCPHRSPLQAPQTVAGYNSETAEAHQWPQNGQI